MYRGRGRGNGFGGNGQRDRGSGRGTGEGGDGSRRRQHDDEEDESSKRQRGDSYGDASSSRNDADKNLGGHRGARPAFLPKEEYILRCRKEEEERKRKEEESYDNVKTRPDKSLSSIGGAGTQLNLIANFFSVKVSEKGWILSNYRVDFEPDEDRTYIKRTMLRAHQHKLKGFVFDGTNLYTPHVYGDELLVMYSESERPTGGPTKVKITLKCVGTVEPGDTQYLQIYSLIIRSCFRILGLDELGRNFYDRTMSTNLAHLRLEIWPGYSTSVRNFDGGIMLNLDLTHKVLRLDTCLERIRSSNTAQAKAELVGNIVITHYNRKTYKVNDIDFDKSPMSTFDHGGVQKTFLDYYREKYRDFPITDFNQPLIVSRPSRKDRHRGQRGDILLIPELCNITGLSDEQRSNFNLMREIHNITSLPPAGRCYKLDSFMNRLRESSEVQGKLRDWEMQLDPNMTKVRGRLLPKEKLVMCKMGQPQTFDVGDDADWTNQLRGMQMHSNVDLKKWAIIVTEQNSFNVEAWLGEMRFVSRGLNFHFNDRPEVVKVRESRNPSGFMDAIGNAMSRLKDCQLLFFILPSSSADIYSAIKRRCNIEYGRGLKSIATKVVIQINAKLGGEPWIAVNPFKSTQTMIVGFDVHHSGKGSQAVSIGAMVATTNNTFSKFYSTVSRHSDKESLSSNMCADFSKCLHAFRTKNNTLPDRVIMYRDGVGQGDLKYVYDIEVKQIMESMHGIYKGIKPSPKFSFIIVTKKGNARIMSKQEGRVDNPPPGTIVDNTITLPERYDFFLVSQQSRRGQTVSPTTYNVLQEEGIGPDKIQRLTHKFCHLYYNWSGTVAVPFVCQYAHKLSYLAGIAYRDSSVFVNENLAHFLYFL